jgi:hypothetical protein
VVVRWLFWWCWCSSRIAGQQVCAVDRTGQRLGLDRWKWPLGEARAAGMSGRSCRCEETARGRSGIWERCFFDVVGRTTNALGGE